MEVGEKLKDIIEELIRPEPKVIGGPQFLYWSHYNPADLDQSTWILVIYRHHFFIGWTVKRDDGIVPE
jgi:hypothetical protein